MSAHAVSLQHWKAPAGHLVEVRQKGAALEALGTLLDLALVAAGPRRHLLHDREYVLQSKLAERLGYQDRRTVSRHVVDLERVGALEKKKDGWSGCNSYAVRWCGRDAYLGGVVRNLRGRPVDMDRLRADVQAAAKREVGPIFFAEIVHSDAFIAQPASWRGMYAVVRDVMCAGADWYDTSIPALAEVCGVSRTTMQDALRYWRTSQLLKVEVLKADDGRDRGIRLRNAGIAAVAIPRQPATRRLTRLEERVRTAIGQLVELGRTTWERLRRDAVADLVGTARMISKAVRDAHPVHRRRAPLGRIARALLGLLGDRDTGSKVEQQLDELAAVADEWEEAGGTLAWIPDQDPATVAELEPGGEVWLRARAALQERLGELGTDIADAFVARTRRSDLGPVLWLRGDHVHSRTVAADLVDELRAATGGYRIGFDPIPARPPDPGG